MMNSRLFFLPVMIGAAVIACFAQPNRITSRIDNARSVILPGRVHPLVNAGNDLGAVENSFPLSLTLLLKPTTDQQSGLQQLIQQQQNTSSTNFHQWLTPEQYADRFGASTSDTAQITAWLQAQGFNVDQVARGRTFITFSGTSGQVQSAFGASIHRYQVNGELHYANAGNPTIPAALSGLVAGFRGMNDFHPKSHLKKAPQPQLSGFGGYELAPADFAAIYDLTPMYSAGINGNGQSIAVVGQSALYKSGSDITTFWKTFGITSAKLVQTLASRQNPGVVQGDVDEASLDIEWAGAVARNATIVFVYSTDVYTSAQYAVDNNVAPVLSMSYGACEMYDLVDLPSNRLLVQQANAQGITWLAAAGDQGAADCDYNPNFNVTAAEGGLAVDSPASIPEVTAMGGTEFNESAGSYWTNGSATGYIPEVAWNETIAAGGILGTGGGASLYFPQPAWQTTGGVPNDGVRHVPDLAFSSSVYHDPYYIYSQGSGQGVGGTSAATPTMAGVVALLNQYLVTNGFQSQAGVGNINPILYRLAQTAPSAFHDVTSGNNNVPCAYGSPDCNNGTQGFSAGPGYDSTTGLGSVDVANLIRQWSGQVATSSLVVPSIDQNPVYQTTSGASGNQWTFQLTLTEEAGIGATLTGFTINGASYAAQIASLFGTATIAPRQSISATDTLSLGTVPQNETFVFSGVDAHGTPWSAALTVPFTGLQTNLTVRGVSNAATGQKVFAPGMILSVYGTGLGTLAQAATTIPLPDYMAGFEASINGVTTPLYYVSPNQVNLQIPYETSTGPATLTVGNPYDSVDVNFTVSAAGPGIFTALDGSGAVVPSTTISAGQTATVYITGDGQVTPSLATGTSPAASTPLSRLPKPRLNLTVTVGGIPATTTFVGIPSWSVGVTQINFTIPAGVPSGVQPVVVTVGTTATPAANITIQ